MQPLRYPCATLLEQAYFESEQHFDATEIRNILATHDPKENFALHGNLLQQLLSRLKSDIPAETEDVDLLLRYCAASLELPLDSLFGSYEFDEEEALRGAVYNSNKYETPNHQGLEFCRFFLRNALQSAARNAHHVGKTKYGQMLAVLTELITPENMHALHPVLEVALTKHGNAFDAFFQLPDEFYLLETAYQAQQPDYREKVGVCGILLRALMFAIAKGTWCPPNAWAHSLTWRMYNPKRGDVHVPKPPQVGDDLHEMQLVQRLLSGYPEQHRHAFAAFSERNVPSTEIIRSLFPIRVPMLNTGPFVKELLLLMTASKRWEGQAHVVFMQELRVQHPDLMELLDLHFQLYLNAEEACDNFGALVEPLMRLATGKVALEHVTLPEL